MASPCLRRLQISMRPRGVGRCPASESLPLLKPALAFNHALPVDLLQSLFALLDPWSVADESGASPACRPTASAPGCSWPWSWLNDGVPLAADVWRVPACATGMARRPARGKWRLPGLPVRSDTIATPTFVVVPGRDTIVPPENQRGRSPSWIPALCCTNPLLATSAWRRVVSIGGIMLSGARC